MTQPQRHAPSIEEFYGRLPVLEAFRDITRAEAYAELPPGWCVIVGDVVDSTGAIRRGAYKEVNMAGAALLVSVFNALGRRDFPFVFGGDGATFALPEALCDQCRPALAASILRARRAFDLELRVGIVPVERLRRDGHPVLVARVRLSRHFDLAAFRGSGVGRAEKLIKDPRLGTEFRLQEPADDLAGNFEGVECRWEPIPSPSGETVALLLQATGDSEAENAEIYRGVLEKLLEVAGERHGFPVTDACLRLARDPAHLESEVRLRTPKPGLRQIFTRLRVLLETRVGDILMRRGLRTPGADWGCYRPDAIENSDHRKFDGALKMVLALTPAQRGELELYLGELLERGKAVHGLHVADAALMTCVIFNRVGGHLHLLDANSGGYAVAASQMKAALAKRMRPSP